MADATTKKNGTSTKLEPRTLHDTNQKSCCHVDTGCKNMKTSKERKISSATAISTQKSAHVSKSNITTAPKTDVENVCTTEKNKKCERTKKTRVIVQFDCGLQNTLFIRGEGVSTLSWDKGVMLQNTAANEWMWQTERPFTKMACKILMNDTQFEVGENHTIAYGENEIIHPFF